MTPAPWSISNGPIAFGSHPRPGGFMQQPAYVVSHDDGHVALVFSLEDARAVAALPDFLSSAASLIEAWDARTTGAQQIITGKSDADLQKQAMAAIDGLRLALSKIGGAG